MGRRSSKGKTASVQVVRGDEVLVRHERNAVILEASEDWPEGYVESFTGVPDDFARPPQGVAEKRKKLTG